MADRSAIEWTEATWNPVTGCDRVSAGCDHCLAPDTPVLMANCSLKPIGDLVVGDKVMSFTETPAKGQNRVIEIATVLATWRTRATTVRITTASGSSVTASDNHRWLSKVRPSWRRSDALSFSTKLCRFGPQSTTTSAESHEFLHGYLAGATAGDGTMRWDRGLTTDRQNRQPYWRVAVLQSDSAILDRLSAALSTAGVTAEIREFKQYGDPRGKYSRRDGRPPAPMAKLEVRNAYGLNVIADMMVEKDSDEWMAGWLSGFLDTDGTSDGVSIRWSQVKKNDYLDRTIKYCAVLGFEAVREQYLGRECTSVRLKTSSLSKKAEFVGRIRPALERKATRFEGRRFSTEADTITSLERGPATELVDITTSSGTFIAGGLATHNCYAMTLAKRLKAMGSAKYQVDGDPRTSGPGFGVTVHPQALGEPLKWRTPRVVFVNSMSDLFHARVPLDFIRDVFDVCRDTPQHTYQVLTKRSLRLRRVADKLDWPENLWMGVSVENSDVLSRVDHLREVPAAVRFLSCEPLLGPLDGIDLTGIGWVIAGGESGPRYRPMQLSWAQGIRDACTEAEVPFFFKQWGGRTPKAAGRELEGQLWDEMPQAATG